MKELESHRKQSIFEGYGSVYHRIYTVRVPISLEQMREAMRKLQSNLNRYCPQMLAKFEKLNGEPEKLNPGDEFQIHISGPWNGPVRVAEVDENYFKLVTLQDHLEAGKIEFRIMADGEKDCVFQIESIARSRDSIVDFFYSKLPVAKAAQTQMWTSYCESFAKEAAENGGGELEKISDVVIRTERLNEKTGQWQEV